MQPATRKTGAAMCIAAISNCKSAERQSFPPDMPAPTNRRTPRIRTDPSSTGEISTRPLLPQYRAPLVLVRTLANNRLDIIRKLIEYGVSVHSIGKCVHTFDLATDRQYDRQKAKFDLLRPYKFTCAAVSSRDLRVFFQDCPMGRLVAGWPSRIRMCPTM